MANTFRTRTTIPAMAALESCFALIWANQHGIAVRPVYG